MDRGHRRHLSAVFEREHPRLWRALYAHVGDRELASDAEAEAWSQLARRGTSISDPAAWLWRAAFRIATGMAGDRRRHVVVPLRDVDVVTNDPAVVEVLSMLDGLSPQQRACVALRYVGGLQPREIAEVLETSAGTVRVQLHRAHESLRHDLEAIND